MLPPPKQIIINEDGVYEVHTTTKRVGNPVDLLINPAPDEVVFTPYPAFYEDGWRGYLGWTKSGYTHLLSVRQDLPLRHYGAPYDPHFSGEDDDPPILTHYCWPGIEVALALTLAPNGTWDRSPYLWLVHDGKTYAPNLPNTYEDGRVCTDSGFATVINQFQQRDPSLLALWRAATQNLFSSAWSGDLNSRYEDHQDLYYVEDSTDPVAILKEQHDRVAIDHTPAYEQQLGFALR